MRGGDFYSGRYLVVGPPGTGKTTFLAKQVRLVVDRFSGPFAESSHPNPVLICSLTRAAAAEVAGRDLPIPREFVGTLHAHCFRVLGRPAIVGPSDISEWNERGPYTLSGEGFSSGRQSDDLADRAEGSGQTEGDKLLARLDMLRHRLTPRDRWSSDVLEFAESWEAFLEERDLCDFTGLIERVYESGMDAPGSPAVIMCDEAQDMSRLEYSVVCRWGESARAIFVVGDGLQALYTWRGADPSIFDDPDVPESHRRVLSQSYRVPRRVLDLAVAWVSEFSSSQRVPEYRPRRGDDDLEVPGVVGVRDSSLGDSDVLVDEIVERVGRGQSVMVQATCGYLLSPFVSNLRRKGVPFSNPWRRHRGDWNPLYRVSRGVSSIGRMLSFCAPCFDSPEPRPWTIADVASFVHPMAVSGVLLRGAKKQIASIVGDPREAGETVDDLGFMAEDPAVPLAERLNAPVLEEEVEEWFEPGVLPFVFGVMRGEFSCSDAAEWWSSVLLAASRKSVEYAVHVLRSRGVAALVDEPRLYVGTCHSFKGAEADCVFVSPDVSSSAHRQWQRGGPDRDDVVRVIYVALTRAREEVYVLRPHTTSRCPLRRIAREVVDGHASA